MTIDFKKIKYESKLQSEKMLNHKYTYTDIKEKTESILMSESDKYMSYFSKDKIYSYDEVINILSEFFNERCIRMTLRITF
ncbi:MAG: hypothetical protein ACRCX8_08245 [Sarcina sp.]